MNTSRKAVRCAAWVMVGAVIALGASVVRAQTPERASPFFRPMTFVPPELPAEFGTQFAGTVFTLSLVVDAVGRVERVEGLEPANVALRTAIDEVARYWIFSPPVDEARCETTSAVGKIRLEFAPGQTQPRLWVDMGRTDRLPQERMQMVWRPAAPDYPREALREGVAANVYATAWLQPHGGVTDVKVRQLLSASGRPTRDWGFESAVQANVAHYRFAPNPDAKPVCFIVPFAFRLRN